MEVIDNKQARGAATQPVLDQNRKIRPADPEQPTPMRVKITHIQVYEHNPREEPNDAYESIRCAILAKRGLDQQLTITRRPGEEEGPFFTYAGGGTRLEILHRCFEETQDEAFLFVDCLFKPYTSEFDLMVAHACENENRANLKWVDKARHINRLRGD